MKTRDGEIGILPNNGESIRDGAILGISQAHAELGSVGNTAIQTKDTDKKDSPDFSSLKEHTKTNEVQTGSEPNDVRSNKLMGNGSVEHESDPEKRNDGSELATKTGNYDLDNVKTRNSPTGSPIPREAGPENLNERSENMPGFDVSNPIGGSDLTPPPSDFNNADKNSLPEVDIHINEHVKILKEKNDSVDEVDRSAKTMPNSLDQQVTDMSPKINENVTSTSNKIDLEKSQHFNEACNFKIESKNLEVEAIPHNSNLSVSKEAYDNPGFVSDEISSNDGKVNDVSVNVEAVPMKTISSEHNVNNSKLPRRVSFSELPPKAVYDNLDFGKDGGENGKVQKDLGSAVKEGEIREMDFLALYGPGEKWRILRNVVLISVAFMVLFTAFFGAANLQSSVNAKSGLGTASLTTLYGALVVSNMFLPVTVIRWLRCKWTVALMALGFAPYAVAQFHAEFYTLIPTALLAGLGAAPMWCAKCTYLNVAADAFAKVTGSSPEVVMVRFFGVFYVLFPLGHVWGNLISSEVLSRGDEEDATNITVDVAAVCGANYCPTLGATENPNLQRPPDYQINTIASIYVACSILAVLLVALGVDNLKRYNEGGRADSGTGLSGLQLLVATARLLVNRNQIALIPITAFIGVSQAFLGADFTEGYISCAWGIPHIGYVLIGYGLASSIASVFVSWVVKTAGRMVVICSSITLFLILVTVMKFWQPSASQGIVFFTLAALWGLADSTALVINAMYGLLFRGNEAAAYSNFSLWGSFGFIVTYSYSPYLCMNTKLAILAVILILAMIGFITAEMALRKILKEQREEEKAKKQQQVCSKPQVT